MPATTFRGWFSYNNIGAPCTASSYIYIINPLTTCSLGKKVCQIYAIYTTSGPSISTTMCTYINNALSNGTSQLAGLATKKYVYVRPV